MDREERFQKPTSYTPQIEESELECSDVAEPLAAAALQDEEYARAMAALASLRGPVDLLRQGHRQRSDPAGRAGRLDLLSRIRDAVHRVADFSKIEG